MEIFRLTPADLHPHLLSCIQQRGVSPTEIEETVNAGWEATDAKPGVSGKVKVFPFGAEWQGQFYPEKEVTVYYKSAGERISLC